MRKLTKKITAGLLASTLMSISAAGAAAAGNILIGDINADGKLTARDLADFQFYLLTGDGTGLDLKNADMSNDGKVNILDLILLKRHFVGDDDQTTPDDDQNEWKYNVSGLDISSNGKILYSNGTSVLSKSITGESEVVSTANEITITESCTLTGQFKNVIINIEPQNDNEELWINMYDVSFLNSKIIVNEENGRKVYFYLPQGDNFTFVKDENNEIKSKYLEIIGSIDENFSETNDYKNSFESNNTMILTKKYYELAGSPSSQAARLNSDLELKKFYTDEEEEALNMVPDIYLCSADNGTITDGPKLSFRNQCVVTGQILCPDSYFGFNSSALVMKDKLRYENSDIDNIYNISVIGKVNVGQIELQNDFAVVYVDHENAEDKVGFRVKECLNGMGTVLGSSEINGKNTVIVRNPIQISSDAFIKPSIVMTTGNGKLSFINDGSKQIRLKNDLVLLNNSALINNCPDDEKDVDPSLICEGKIYAGSQLTTEGAPINIFAGSYINCPSGLTNIDGNLYCYECDPNFDINKKIEELSLYAVPVFSYTDFTDGKETGLEDAVTTFGNLTTISGKCFTKGSLIISYSLSAEELRVDQLLYIKNPMEINIKKIYAKGGICIDSIDKLLQNDAEIYTSRIIDTYGKTIAEYDETEGIIGDNIHIVSEDDQCFEWSEYNEMP